ncbi:MAG: AMP-binding protein [Eubacteriaceae bacterium]|nr:AMP-binding protein [Eubacteriaceae bacterium]
MSSSDSERLKEVGFRIREMREIFGLSTLEMAAKTDVPEEDYVRYEAGMLDFPFSFLHKCSLVFGIGITDLMEGQGAHLNSYTVTRKGQGEMTAKEEGILITDLAPRFRRKIAEPYFVRYEYEEDLQDRPIATTTHSGQEFDYIMSGRLKVQVGDNIEYLSEGDSIYYNSSTPHGMIAVDGRDCLFLAVVLPGEDMAETIITDSMVAGERKNRPLAVDPFIKCTEDAAGRLTGVEFPDSDRFNFAFDVVDEIGRREPQKLALLHVGQDMMERRFTFRDIKRMSAQCANYFKALGIRKGDRVMLVMKRHYQFWPAIIGLHKMGAIAIPATHQLKAHDYEYRFNAAGVKAIVCAMDDNVPAQVEEAEKNSPTLETKILIGGGSREGWRNFDDEFPMYSPHYYRTEDSPCGDDPMVMFFTSGTTGYPKIATHSYKYPLGHFITAKYWHGASYNGLHFTISDTGWGKALWGKLYGQWMCESAVFAYDFDRFDAEKILPMFEKYQITSFCAPPTMLRMMMRADISKYDMSSVRHMTTAGEALTNEIYTAFEKQKGIKIREGFGQTETTLSIANLLGDTYKVGSIGKAIPIYDIVLMDTDGNILPDGETGEICIRTSEKVPCGLFRGYYNNDEATAAAWHDGYYHTGDLAWRDEDDFYWFVGRFDDVIKSSGYRIGPFEIESVILELPYVLECGVSAAPDEVRGQVVKATVVLTEDRTPSPELTKEIQDYVKQRTAPYKYPRIVEYTDSLPKTISGKIQRYRL